MPDLSTQAVHQFWKDFNDPTIYQTISFMESVEHWVYDNRPAIEGALKKLGDAFDDIPKFELKHEEDYIKVGANLKMGRLLSILQAVDKCHPGSASKVLMFSEEHSKTHTDDVITFYLRRNVAFERLRLMSRVFSPERLELLSKLLEGEDQDE